MGRRKQSNPGRNALAGEAAAAPAEPAEPPPLEDADWDVERSARHHGRSGFAPPKKRGRKEETTHPMGCDCTKNGAGHSAPCEPFPIALVPLVDTTAAEGESGGDLSGCKVVLRLLKGLAPSRPFGMKWQGVPNASYLACELTSAPGDEGGDGVVVCKVEAPPPPPPSHLPCPTT